MYRVILLLVVLSVCLSFRAVIADCFNASHENCATCYQTLADALINTDDNKYSLTKSFFPPNTTPPVLVEVTYLFESNCNKTWYWTEGPFFVYQPVEVFLYRSLLFSPISMRQGSITLNLPYECRDSPDSFLRTLTQRLKAYATFQTTIPRVDDSYVAKAVNGNNTIDYMENKEYGKIDGVEILSLLYVYQCVPFAFAFLIVSALIVVLFCSLCTSCGVLRKVTSEVFEGITKDTNHQANTMAIVGMCFCFTLFSFVLDIISVHKERTLDLPNYYERNGIYAYTIVFATIYLVLFIFSFPPLIVYFLWYSYQKRRKYEEGLKKHQKIKHLPFLFFIVCCVGSTMLSLSFHSQNILIAWTMTPMYASKIALYYGIVLFVYYFTFKNTYNLPFVFKKYASKDEINDEERTAAQPQQQPPPRQQVNGMVTQNNTLLVVLGIVFVIVIGIALSGFHALNVVFIYYVPINHSIEESVTGIGTIYNGAVVLIGALVAYNLGWFYYHSMTFSVETALQKAIEEQNEYPFGKDKIQNDEDGWRALSAQNRMKQIIKGLLFHKGKEYKV